MNSILSKMWFALKIYRLSILTIVFAFTIFSISYLIPQNANLFGFNISNELRSSTFGFIVSSMVVAIFTKLWEGEQVNSLLKIEISQYIEERYNKFYPIMEFNPQNKLLDDVFNVQLMFHLKKSKGYFFYGVTARHCGLRLLSLNNENKKISDIYICITHPNYINIDNDYIKYSAQVNQISLNDQVNKTRKDIIFALYTLHKAALYLQRNVMICFSNHSSLSRFELMDEVVFFSVQDILNPSVYPESFMFNQQSVWYKYATNEIQAAKNKQSSILKFGVNDDVDSFIKNINSLDIHIAYEQLAEFNSKIESELVIYRKMNKF